MQRDLKISGAPFERFQTFDRENSLRLLSRSPPDLSHTFHPIFAPELLNASQLIGLVLDLDNPIRARLLIKTAQTDHARQLAAALHDDPHRWLHLADSDLLLFAENPTVTQQDTTIEVNFNLPENSARLLLQRLAKTDTPTVVAAQPSEQQ
jgi:hypothetical protein